MTSLLKYGVPRLGRGIKSEGGGLVTATFAFSRSEEETIMRRLLEQALSNVEDEDGGHRQRYDGRDACR